jgi:hypothetical protein
MMITRSACTALTQNTFMAVHDEDELLVRGMIYNPQTGQGIRGTEHRMNLAQGLFLSHRYGICKQWLYCMKHRHCVGGRLTCRRKMHKYIDDSKCYKKKN